jgi:hypothetical protein
MNRVCINILNHHGRNFWKLHAYSLNRLRRATKDKIRLRLLVSGNIPELDIDFPYEVVDFGNHFNYMNKVRNAIEQPEEFSAKLDDDIIFSPHAIDFLVENVNLLRQPDILGLTASGANCTPQTEYFIEDFMNGEQKDRLYEIFKGERLDASCNGLVPGFACADERFLVLDKYVREQPRWNPRGFWQVLSTIENQYLGIHPVRVSKQAQQWTLDYILQDINKFYMERQCNFETIEAPYICNGFTFLETKRWKELVLDESLISDAFEEVNLNRYAWRHNMKFLVARHAYAAHFFYNLCPEFTELETHYVNLFKEKLGIS